VGFYIKLMGQKRSPRAKALAKSINHEAHEEHEGSADLAAACGGEAMCVRQRRQDV
jgi:hypothetical protein